MFLNFYQLKRQPFGVTPDPHFLYFGASHESAFSALLSSVQERRGFSALIAKPGMGKTSLLFKLLDLLKDSARTGFLFQTHGESREILSSLLHDLDADPCVEDWPSMQKALNAALMRESKDNRQVVVVIDEAQNLSDDAFESLRLLSNFEKPDAKLLHIILAGQPALAQKMSGAKLAQLRQRLSVVVELAPLTLGQTADYIDHRLKLAGYKGQPLFTYEALQFIAQTSEGIPRVINNLCFHSLSLSCSAKKKAVDLSIAHAAARSLELERGQYSAFAPVSRQHEQHTLNDKISADFPTWSEPIDHAPGFYPGSDYRRSRKRLSAVKIGSAAFACSVLFLAVYLVFGAGLSPAYLTNWLKTTVSEKVPAPTDSLPKPDTQLGESQIPPPIAQAAEPPDPAKNDLETKPHLPSGNDEGAFKVPPDSPPSPAKRPASARQRNSGSKRKMRSDRYKTLDRPTTVQVNRTETLFQFALEKYGRADWTTVRKIRAVNPQIRDPYEVLHRGQLIKLPTQSISTD